MMPPTFCVHCRPRGICSVSGRHHQAICVPRDYLVLPEDKGEDSVLPHPALGSLHIVGRFADTSELSEIQMAINSDLDKSRAIGQIIVYIIMA